MPAPWDLDLRLLTEFAFTVPAPWWEPDQPLASIGLFFREFEPYPDTPPMAHPVLSCGVDGIHWSAMTADSSSGYLVVMTVPPSTGVNLVVGESLSEFLSLGCRSHFTCLAGLVQDITAPIDIADDEPFGDVMAALRSRFSLSPWPNVAARLSEREHATDAPRAEYRATAKPRPSLCVAVRNSSRS